MKKRICLLFLLLSIVTYSWGKVENSYDGSVSLGVVLNYDIETNTYKGTASIIGSLDNKNEEIYILSINFDEILEYTESGKTKLKIVVDDFFSKEYKVKISNTGTGIMLTMNKKLIDAMSNGKKVSFFIKTADGSIIERNINLKNFAENLKEVRVSKYLY